jgi:hypothetical protein
MPLGTYDDAADRALDRVRCEYSPFNFSTLSDENLIPAETRNYVLAALSAVNLLETIALTLDPHGSKWQGVSHDRD